MCIAILNTAGHTIKRDHLKNSWENNTDGAGILFIKDNKMAVYKEMASFDAFYDKYLEIKRNHGHNNIVLHFRISTHGKINKDNCHPFLVDDELGFVHNGMIYDVPTSVDYSDTYMFNEKYLKLMKKGFDRSDEIMDMIAMYIGTGNKLIFLNANDEYTIVNEKAGHWHKGSWFSNTSYQRINDYYDFGGTKRYKNGTSRFNHTTLSFEDDFEDLRKNTSTVHYIDGKKVKEYIDPMFDELKMEVDQYGIIRDLEGKYLGYYSKSLDKITWGTNAKIPVFEDDTCDCGLSAEERGKLGAECSWCADNSDGVKSYESDCYSCGVNVADTTISWCGTNYDMCSECAHYFEEMQDDELGA